MLKQIYLAKISPKIGQRKIASTVNQILAIDIGGPTWA